MKQFTILISFVALTGCKINTQRLQVSAIQTEPKRMIKVNPETGTTYTFTSRSRVTKRLPYQIFMLSKTAEKLKFRIQGNIYSSGHHINRIRKIRFEKGKQLGNAITLRYFVELQRKPGKENVNVEGYNYTKDEIYEIPHDVKIIKIELYEDRLNDHGPANPTLMTQQRFDFFAKI
ncbi:hypothetical protein [Sphingobacterium sp. HMA12]|uniref:hypothetical protein n=1 Tax=Sphingobacterium sp. HMA12 TaxID=2050894 RepID=UPI000CEA2C7A|nr:hypothetical protein [Sphingobacterium sp. HMA12]